MSKYGPRIPKVGEEYTVSELTGYILSQNRPACCKTWRPSKKNPPQYTSNCEGECGGNCNGKTTHYKGVVEEVIYWADNSIEATVRCEDGKVRIKRLVAPHGDLC